MSDSDSLRSRRKRQHARGQHDLCQPEHCAERGRQLAGAILEAAPEDGPGAPRVSAAVARLVASLPLAADLARAVLAASLEDCAAAIGELGPTPALLRELRVTLAALCPPEPGERAPDFVDELHKRRAARCAALGWRTND